MSNDSLPSETIAMQTKEPAIGETAYLAGGEIVRLLAKNSDGQFVVEVGHYEDDNEEGDIFFDGIRRVSRLYAKPPIAAVDKRIAELESKEVALLGAIRELQNKQKEATAALASLKTFECLNDIDAFLQGKITNYVVWERPYGDSKPSRIRITTPEEEKSGNDRRESDLKMLGLYGKQDWNKKGASPDPEWRLTHYSDGSGSSWESVKPFLSLDDAKKFAAIKLSEVLAFYSEKQCDKWTLDSLIQSCRSCSYDVPAWVVDKQKAATRAVLQSEIDKQLKALKSYQDQLAAASV